MSDLRYIAVLIVAWLPALAAAAPAPGLAATPAPVAAPAPPVATPVADGTAQANTRLVAPQPNRSPVDSELIQSTPGATAANSSTPGSGGAELSRVGAALAIVIALILGLRWGGKKLFGSAAPGRSTRAVQVLSRSPISPRQSILLVRVGKRLLVVGDSGVQMNPLTEITDPDEVAALVGQLQESHAGHSAGAFGKLFHRAAHDMEVTQDESAMREEPTESSESGAADPVIDPAIHETREELTGLMEKIRSLSRSFPAQ